MKVQEFLDTQHVPYDVLTHQPTFDAQHMAHAVHTAGDMVAKTVLLRADHGFRYVMAIVPANGKINLAAASKALGDAELVLAEESEVTNVCPECESGILLPFGSQYGVKTLFDASLAEKEMIVFEGNVHSESIRMKTADFIRLESPIFVPLAILA